MRTYATPPPVRGTGSLFVPRYECVRESLHASPVVPNANNAETHVGGDFLAPHPRCLATKCATFETMHTTTEHVEGLVIVARKHDVGLVSSCEALDELLEFVTGCVRSPVSRMVELDANTGHHEVALILAQIVIPLQSPLKFEAHNHAIVVLLVEPLVVVAVNSIVVKPIQLPVELNRSLELLIEPNVGEFVDMAGTATHTLHMVSGIEDEIRPLLAEKPDHVIKQVCSEHLVPNVAIGDVTEREGSP